MSCFGTAALPKCLFLRLSSGPIAVQPRGGSSYKKCGGRSTSQFDKHRKIRSAAAAEINPSSPVLSDVLPLQQGIGKGIGKAEANTSEKWEYGIRDLSRDKIKIKKVPKIKCIILSAYLFFLSTTLSIRMMALEVNAHTMPLHMVGSSCIRVSS